MSEPIEVEEPKAKVKEPRLNISFSYDHASGTFKAHMENGSSFSFDRANVSGKLENALVLFSRAVVNTQSGRWAKPPKSAPDFNYSYDESQVRRFKGRNLILELGDLDLGDLEV